jgi:hypothetical protein
MSFHGYWAYGLRIHAELECPELPALQDESAEPDVTIHLLPAADHIPELTVSRRFHVQPGLFQLRVPETALYCVEDGKRIFITPFSGASMDKVRLFLLGSTLGALLYQRGLFPLHGSAVETPWGAMVFVGAQGVGKSTLAAEFHRKGYRLLSDDVCAVESTPDGLQVLPALSHIRLCPDAYDRLGTPQNARFDVDKFLFPMGDGYCPDPLPLCAIHILGNHEGEVPEYHNLRGMDRVVYLLGNLYRRRYLQGQDTQGALMRMAGEIAEKCTIATVSRRRDPESIHKLVEFLELEWAERFVATPLKEMV